MTRLQYCRWYAFARRMALRTFLDATPARRARIAEEIRRVIWVLKEEVPNIVSWDGPNVYVCDRISELLDPYHYHYRINRDGDYVERGNRFLNQVSCCLRAGLDMASEPSAGVLGWTVGDLRRMYPLGIPGWVSSAFRPSIDADTADDAGVWL